jgi:hypothetical protein
MEPLLHWLEESAGRDLTLDEIAAHAGEPVTVAPAVPEVPRRAAAARAGAHRAPHRPDHPEQDQRILRVSGGPEGGRRLHPARQQIIDVIDCTALDS